MIFLSLKLWFIKDSYKIYSGYELSDVHFQVSLVGKNIVVVKQKHKTNCDI